MRVLVRLTGMPNWFHRSCSRPGSAGNWHGCFAVYGVSLCLALLSAVPMPAADLERYREFRIGADLASIARQVHQDPAQARVLHQRPALIQELQWEPRATAGTASSPDPVKEVTFRFYNGQLYRIAIDYDRYNTAGLTADDFIEALSSSYGTATRPSATVNMESLTYADSEQVIARWDDSKYSVNLLRSTYLPTFGVLAFSKQMQDLAQTAIAEAARLEELEAPQREAASLKKQAEKEQADRNKARVANKPNFRP